MKNIINIVNFVRAKEPRPGRNIDLMATVAEQISVMRSHSLRGTFLLQYDTLLDSEFSKLFKENYDICELGIWLEIVQPQVEAAGGAWRGRYPWDWYNDVGFLIGYEPEFRKLLVDTAMEKFKEVYGTYPRCVGAWHIDAVSMKYIHEKYKVDACCICRDQVGMDGYTLQGGYYNQAYYPSENNMFCPANDEKAQINMPVFRMLGSDPILAYDHQVFGYDNEKAPTLEPAQRGRNPQWCDWYFSEVINENGLSFQYTQTGQENSFGWERMKNGYRYQFALIKRLCDEGRLELMTLAESGRWYKQNFSTTPPSTYCAMSAWDKADRKSVWYYSRFYRTNIFWDCGKVRVRDLYIFNDQFKEHYLDSPCTSHACEFRNLPIIDGTIYSTAQSPAGVYFTNGDTTIEFDQMEYSEDKESATVSLKSGEHTVTITLKETCFSVQTDFTFLVLKAIFDTDRLYGKFDATDSQFTNHNNSEQSITFVSSVLRKNNCLDFVFNGFEYSLKLTKGKLLNSREIMCIDGKAEVCFGNKESL